MSEIIPVVLDSYCERMDGWSTQLKSNQIRFFSINRNSQFIRKGRKEGKLLVIIHYYDKLTREKKERIFDHFQN